ncbi:MAG TPA: lipopolysaccharide heptosyltransferase II [Candidatus Hydrogenedentes bacterium]|nr:lipopolysaccharide heptosyltransferase II [Candidatus Hydrogenedentota bacterium]
MELPKNVKHILALAPNWLGDAVMCTPALRVLKRRFPEAELTVTAKFPICDLLQGLPWIDRLAPISSRPGLFRMLQIAAELHPHARDLAVIFPHSARAALLAMMAGASNRLGYQRGQRSWFLTDTVQPYREKGVIVPIYMAKEYLDLLKPLGCEDDDQGLELVADPKEIDAVRGRCSGEGPLIGLAPGAAFGSSKRWPAERYAQVADLLAQKTGARFVLLTGPGEEETRAEALKAAKTTFIECYDQKPTIARLKAAISEVDMLIGNDSGPRHIAIAFKKPVICIMGSTSPRYTDSPWEVGKIVRVDVDCGPCQKPVCETDHRCMTRISPEMVMEAALPFLPH